MAGRALALTMAVAGFALGAARSSQARTISYPGTVVPAKREAEAPNNSERLRRGMPLRAPKRLYDPSRIHSAPKARLSSTPPPTSEIGYDLQYCSTDLTTASDGQKFTIHVFSDGGDGTAVTACAAQATGEGFDDFVIYYDTDNEDWVCWTGATPGGTEEDCTSDNYAWYSAS